MCGGVGGRFVGGQARVGAARGARRKKAAAQDEHRRVPSVLDTLVLEPLQGALDLELVSHPSYSTNATGTNVSKTQAPLVTVVSGRTYLQVPKHVALSDVGYISTLFKNTVSNTRMEQNLPMQTKAGM